jgi:hypothetical protein
MATALQPKKQDGSLLSIAKRAAVRKADPTLRHVPNEDDLRVITEHTKFMVYPQFQTIKPDKEDSK